MFNKEEEKEGKFLKSFKPKSKFFQRSPFTDYPFFVLSLCQPPSKFSELFVGNAVRKRVSDSSNESSRSRFLRDNVQLPLLLYFSLAHGIFPVKDSRVFFDIVIAFNVPRSIPFPPPPCNTGMRNYGKLRFNPLISAP